MFTKEPPRTRNPEQRQSTKPPRTRWLFAAAALTALVVGLIALDRAGDGDDLSSAEPPLELSLGAGDALASCLPLDVQILADMSPAFAATATAIEGDVVTLEVDRWYVGGDAAIVELHAEPGQGGLIAGFDFAVGQRYLITATEGQVNFCGYSGPATPELTGLFDQAFAA